MTIDVVGRENCSGCSLCSIICPHQSIQMKADKEGFLQPRVDVGSCVDCGLCYKMCPCKEESAIEVHPVYYTGAINDKPLLKKSSSGGVFIALASWFVEHGGYVCGCVYNAQMEAVHICTCNMEDVKRMMGSKYVQSNISSSLIEIKKYLKEDRKVLFTGTACQVAAVKRYTNDHANLFCVDILCHGVPSPLYLKMYAEYLEKKHNGKLVNLEFRNKAQRGWGSEHRTYYEIEKDGNVTGYRPNLPAYFCAFFWGLNLRESCYHCKFTGTNRISDITIGDFWGYWSYFKKNFPDGISIISVNNEKGKHLIADIEDRFDFKYELEQSKALGTNTNFYHPTPKPSTRDSFYTGIEHNSYRGFSRRVFLDRTIRKKLLVSAYGCYVPESIRNLIRKIIR